MEMWDRFCLLEGWVVEAGINLELLEVRERVYIKMKLGQRKVGDKRDGYYYLRFVFRYVQIF